nr:YHS domain-containing protein [Cupriavidus sp. UYPR2.512]
MSTRSATPFGGKYGVVGGQTPQAAGHDEPTRQQRVRDPVCGMEISPGEANASAEVDQRHYLFCSSHCEQTFFTNSTQSVPRPIGTHLRASGHGLSSLSGLKGLRLASLVTRPEVT